MSLIADLQNPFNSETNDIRFTIERNIQHAMYSIDKEVIDGRMVATDLTQIQRRVKRAVALGLAGHKIDVRGLIAMDERDKEKAKK